MRRFEHVDCTGAPPPIWPLGERLLGAATLAATIYEEVEYPRALGQTTAGVGWVALARGLAQLGTPLRVGLGIVKYVSAASACARPDLTHTGYPRYGNPVRTPGSIRRASARPRARMQRSPRMRAHSRNRRLGLRGNGDREAQTRGGAHGPQAVLPARAGVSP